MQGRAGAGCGRNSTPRRKAAKTQSDFFYYETRKPGIIGKISWFPGFLMELFLVAPLRLGGFALSVFCMMADCKVWPAAWWLTARSGRPQGPGQKASDQHKAGPGPDTAGIQRQ